MFVLEQQDPRYRGYTNLNRDDIIKEVEKNTHNNTSRPSTTIYNNSNSDYSNSRRTLQIISTGDDKYIKPSEAPEIIKPSEIADLIKPSI